MNIQNKELEEAIFAAGCFWGVEETFRQSKGVKETEVGYTGGHTESPTYEQVCGDYTGHAEAVRVVFDPKETSYEELLKIFWKLHDPTTMNRQGPDVGSQYRSAVFYENDDQKAIAEKVKTDLEKRKVYQGQIVTEIVPLDVFYKAEDYHQKYFQKNGGGVCHV
jgi:peptide-methionine (S)-S-oxide reductase